MVSTTTNGTILSAAVAARQFHSFQITTKPMMPAATMVGDRDAIGRGKPARGAEQHHQQQDADQQQRVDARQIGLPGMRLGGEADLEARQQTELPACRVSE